VNISLDSTVICLLEPGLTCCARGPSVESIFNLTKRNSRVEASSLDRGGTSRRTADPWPSDTPPRRTAHNGHNTRAKRENQRMWTVYDAKPSANRNASGRRKDDSFRQELPDDVRGGERREPLRTPISRVRSVRESMMSYAEPRSSSRRREITVTASADMRTML